MQIIQLMVWNQDIFWLFENRQKIVKNTKINYVKLHGNVVSCNDFSQEFRESEGENPNDFDVLLNFIY